MTSLAGGLVLEEEAAVATVHLHHFVATAEAPVAHVPDGPAEPVDTVTHLFVLVPSLSGPGITVVGQEGSHLTEALLAGELALLHLDDPKQMFFLLGGDLLVNQFVVLQRTRHLGASHLRLLALELLEQFFLLLHLFLFSLLHRGLLLGLSFHHLCSVGFQMGTGGW